SWKAAQDKGRIYAMARDVTELRDAENKLMEARQELAQVSRRTTLAAMSAAIAHEIRQPLGAIVTNANAGLRWLDRATPDLGEVRDSLKQISADGHRASEVIQSVRAMFGKSDPVGTPLDANELVLETIAMANDELEAAKIDVQLELAGQLPLIPAHRGQLQQVVLNIVTNAAESMRNIDDRARTLRVRSRPFDSNGVALSVQDCGAGIDPENMERIFDAFFTTKANGMGMGLAICRSIVEAHGGTLSASPGVPYGSIFHIVLPGIQ
ncbi:MAG: ATP-binding protein, partial [Pseudolabrys sp.]